MKIVAVIVSMVMLSGCVTTGGSQSKLVRKQLEVKLEMLPTLNVVHTAEVGQSLVARRFLNTTSVIKVNQPVTHNINDGMTRLAMVASAGIYDEIGSGELGEYYEDKSFMVNGKLNDEKKSGYLGGLIVPPNSDMATHMYRNPQMVDANIPVQLASPVKIERLKKTVAHKDNFVRELTYAGVSKNVVTIVYREFANDIARPAFTQELKYDLGEGRVIGYRGARFEIIQASNTEIQYRVLKHLD